MQTRKTDGSFQKSTPKNHWVLFGVFVWMLILTGVLAGCSSEPKPPEIPTFPEYEPTKKFLILQDRVREWAEEIEYKKEVEVVQNIIKGRNKTYRAWKPIYDRIEDHERRKTPRK